MARDDRGICLQRGRRRGEREREGKSLDDTRNRGISRCFNNRAGFDKSVTSMNFCRALEFFAGQRWWWWWWWVGLSRSRDVSRKIHFTVLHAAVLPTACRRKITKKKRKKGRGEGIEKRKKGKKKGESIVRGASITLYYTPEPSTRSSSWFPVDWESFSFSRFFSPSLSRARHARSRSATAALCVSFPSR